MTKDLYEKKLSHNKLYLCSSKDIKRPLIYIQEEAHQLLQLYNIHNSNKVYENSYYNEYLGKINYTEYNTLRED